MTLIDRLLIYFYFDSVPFTRDVIEGRTSLGGSESALLMLARALARRGHDVHVFCAKLALQDDEPRQYADVSWAHGEQLIEQMAVQPPDVFCSLRSTAPFAMKLNAGLNLLWNQDLINDVSQVAYALPQVDALVFVSEFHAYQWTHQSKDISRKTIGALPHFITRNPFEPERVPAWPETIEGEMQRALAIVARIDAESQRLGAQDGVLMPAELGAQIQQQRHPLGCKECELCLPGCELGAAIDTLCRLGAPGYKADLRDEPVLPTGRSLTKFCHISRPERALDPLLAIWPKIRARVPNAELHLCRYNSMYDATGWGAVCATYDAKVAAVNAQVGGIVWHGELSKERLYDLLTSCSLMLYPGIHDFAETSCIAAIEAQACGCVPICSYKGALPETIGEGAGVLIAGDSTTDDYHDSFVEAVYTLSDPVEGPPMLADMREKGRAHVVPQYSADAVAENWEDFICETFRDRFSNNRLKVLRQLLHYDNHTAALLLANELHEEQKAKPFSWSKEDRNEVSAAIELCHDVIAQRAQTAEDYGKYSMDTVLEAQLSERFQVVIKKLQDANVQTLLDVACGNGSFALAALTAMPDLYVQLVDYSDAVLAKARAALDAAGMQDRYATLALNLSTRPTLPLDWLADKAGWPANDPLKDFKADAVWCGEYVEHTEKPHEVLLWLEDHVRYGGLCVTSTPCGPMSESITYYTPLQRGHTHHLTVRELGHMLDGRPCDFQYLSMGRTPRGNETGFWVSNWTVPTVRPPMPAIEHWRTIYTTRPYARIVGMMLVKDSEDWITKCLKSVWSLVDGMVLLDTGSHPADRTEELARKFPRVQYFHIDEFEPELVWPKCGFGAARNKTLDLAVQCFAPDWVLWIDSDEHLEGGHTLHTHLGLQSPYLGLITKQIHVQAHEPVHSDIPMRVFRTGAGIRFVGMVHEAPEMETTEDTRKQQAAEGLAVERTSTVFPSIDVATLNFIHYGYEDEATNQWKMRHRNYPLMRAEVADAKCRRMALVLFMRDLVTLAQMDGAIQQSKQGKLSEQNKLHLLSAMRIYHSKGFDNPKDPKHNYAFPYYQKALELLGAGVEIVLAMKAAPRGEVGSAVRHRIAKAEPQRVFVMNAEEADVLLKAKLAEAVESMRPPVLLVDPVGQRPADVVPATDRK